VKAPLQGAVAAGATESAFVSKISPDGKTLVHSTYLGGSAVQAVNAIAVDAAGNVYIAGFTSSKDFPLQGALQPAYGGGTSDAWAAKLDATGSKLLYSTYLGGSGRERVAGVAIDAAGNAYIAGATTSPDFPWPPWLHNPKYTCNRSHETDPMCSGFEFAPEPLRTGAISACRRPRVNVQGERLYESV
jgi:hypothetical protein